MSYGLPRILGIWQKAPVPFVSATFFRNRELSIPYHIEDIIRCSDLYFTVIFICLSKYIHGAGSGDCRTPKSYKYII